MRQRAITDNRIRDGDVVPPLCKFTKVKIGCLEKAGRQSKAPSELWTLLCRRHCHNSLNPEGRHAGQKSILFITIMSAARLNLLESAQDPIPTLPNLHSSAQNPKDSQGRIERPCHMSRPKPFQSCPNHKEIHKRTTHIFKHSERTPAQVYTKLGSKSKGEAHTS